MGCLWPIKCYIFPFPPSFIDKFNVFLGSNDSPYENIGLVLKKKVLGELYMVMDNFDIALCP